MATADVEAARQRGSTARTEVSGRKRQLVEPNFGADAEGAEATAEANARKFLHKLSVSTGKQGKCVALAANDLQTYIQAPQPTPFWHS